MSSFVVFDAGILLVIILLRVLVRLICSDARGNVLGNQPVHTIGIVPLDVAELIVERLDDI